MNKNTSILLAILSLLFLTGCGGGDGPNVLLILVDTVRADHFSCYGYSRQTTPFIDSLAQTGTMALRCQGQSSWTLPSMTTIMSGRTPVEHGAGRRNGVFHGVSPDLPWLPMAFYSAGYRTAAFFNVMFMNEDFGFHRGFRHFDCQGVASGNSLRKAGSTVDDFLAWLDSSDGSEPFFAAVHFYDPHIPYDPPAPWDTMFTDPSYQGEYGTSWGTGITEMMAVNAGETVPSEADIHNLVALYDGEIAYTDSEIGRLLREIRARGLGENTIIVLVGDHGEEFLEHDGIEHGRTLYQELTHVPLILAGPGFQGGRVIEEPVAQYDLSFTLARATGVDFPVLDHQVDLAAEQPVMRRIFASGVLWRQEGDLVSVVEGDMKLIWSVEDDSVQAFHLGDDPAETEPVEPCQDLLEEAGFYWATPPEVMADVVDYSETAARELRNLGYIR
ncbi:MAG TPA: sulfatase [Candidatus Sabulitectum sp.]|nr:sulfatase [Candidatus Sabulitectum sp.]HPJ27700.1 sulfatase [Candidatus Sabulitectum sp.]HPR22795.1 sulfatase [Candidatus Sabulitectum sp.]